MLRRACLWLLPVLWVFALPGPTAGAHGLLATAIERNGDVGGAAIACTPLQRDQAVASWGQWTNQDDDSDRLIEASAPAAWAPGAHAILPLSTSEVLPRAPPISAAFPRGPPSV